MTQPLTERRPPALLFIGIDAKLGRFLEVALNRRGYRVHVAADWNRLPELPCDVVFLGWENAQSLVHSHLDQARARFPSLPVAALSQKLYDPSITDRGPDAVVSLSLPLPHLLAETQRLLARVRIAARAPSQPNPSRPS